jgi:hypothetical protein
MRHALTFVRTFAAKVDLTPRTPKVLELLRG